MLTVLMATHNRCSILSRTLESYCDVRPPQHGWELIIVDNASTDDTRHVIESYKAQLPIRYCFEPHQGKNLALNHGVEFVKGELIVFTDDDVLPRKDWLCQYERIVQEHPEYDVFGGVTLPRWEVCPPEWVLAWVPLGPTFTLSPPTLKTGPSAPCYTFGTNYALRYRVLQAGYRFDTTIGPKGTNYAMGSETELIRRLVHDGFRIWHSSEMVVEHWIEANKLNKRWVMRRAYRYGRGQYRLSASKDQSRDISWFGVPRMFRVILVRGCRLLLAKLRRQAKLAFDEEWNLMYSLGAMSEAWKEAGTFQRGDEMQKR